MEHIWFIVIMLVAACSIATVTTAVTSDNPKWRKHPLTLLCGLICIILTLVGAFTFISLSQGEYMQPRKQPEYEQIQEPLYRKKI